MSITRHRLTVAFALAVLIAGPGRALAQATESGDVCQEAGTLAERANNIPAGMLVAIGRVESGRRHPATGATVPWPWTINAAGSGRMFDSAIQAIEATRMLRAGGMASIDVGCFQVNLMHHSTAFSSLDRAFDPQTNADYAARFLTSLKERTGSWEDAIAAYHSSTPALGGPYRDKVLGRWTGSTGGLAPSRPTMTVWAMPVAAFGMRVWTPSAAGAAPSAVAMGGVSAMARVAVQPLPVVETAPAASDLPLPRVRAGLPPGMGRTVCGALNRCMASR